MPDKHLTDTRFRSLDISPAILRGLEDLELEFCTPIQALALPLALAGKDVAGQAQTGTGKTAAFLVAAMNHLLKYCEATPADAEPRDPRAFILAPTRELAIQIHRDAVAIGKHTGLSTGLAYGGTGYETQRRTLTEGVDILVGTPGRLIDYYKQRVYTLRNIEVVILDEADRMFDLGFIADLRYLLRRMPAAGQRLNMLFSATMSLRVHEMAYEHMNGPQVVQVEAEHITADKVEQTLYHVARQEKVSLLLGLLKERHTSRVLIFVNTRRVADRLAAHLQGNQHRAGVLSGDIPQNKRQQLLEQFKNGELPILVATDVAARGLHIPEVGHVINFDLPQDAEDYVHRIGRTARAGAAGSAISFACEEYVYSLPEIEQFIGMPIATLPITEDLLVEPAPPRRRPPGQEHKGNSRPRGRHTSRGGRPGGSSAAGDSKPADKRRRRRRGPNTKAPAGS